MAPAIHWLRKASGMATAYMAIEIVSLGSLPTALASSDFGPSSAINAFWSRVYAPPEMSRTRPYTAVGSAAKLFSSIQPVTHGASDKQNNKCRVDHSILALTGYGACS